MDEPRDGVEKALIAFGFKPLSKKEQEQFNKSNQKIFMRIYRQIEKQKRRMERQAKRNKRKRIGSHPLC